MFPATARLCGKILEPSTVRMSRRTLYHRFSYFAVWWCARQYRSATHVTKFLVLISGVSIILASTIPSSGERRHRRKEGMVKGKLYQIGSTRDLISKNYEGTVGIDLDISFGSSQRPKTSQLRGSYDWTHYLMRITRGEFEGGGPPPEGRFLRSDLWVAQRSQKEQRLALSWRRGWIRPCVELWPNSDFKRKVLFWLSALYALVNDVIHIRFKERTGPLGFQHKPVLTAKWKTKQQNGHLMIHNPKLECGILHRRS